MLVFRFQVNLKATGRQTRASLKNMSPGFSSGDFSTRRSNLAPASTHAARRILLATLAIALPQLLILLPAARATAAQTNDQAATPPATTMPLDLGESLRPALEIVGSSVSRLQIDHWKVSGSWKAQLQSDADSIQQDLSHQLPALFQQAEASPADLAPQMQVMRNVDALYDVLVRLTMAADLTEKKTDAALLDSALQQLEAARKGAYDRLMQNASSQNQQIVRLKEQLVQSHPTENVAGPGPKTIVVDNGVSHRTKHHTTHHKETEPAKPAAKTKPNPTPPATDKPSSQH